MPIIDIDTLVLGKKHPQEHQLYNGMDVCLTLEIFQNIQKIHNKPPEIYSFTRAMQAPALEMMLRGFLIDQEAKNRGIEYVNAQIAKYDNILQILAFAVWGKSLNPRSTKQLLSFFYQHMHLPEQWTSQKGQKKLAMNRESLEKLETYLHARPFVSCILAIRDLKKELETLESAIDNDGRMRYSYNIVGTETGRWSSSKSSTGTGLNAQNIKRKLRNAFIADPGKKLCGIDLEQAESREVGWLCGIFFNDWSYLNACLSGDLHTLTCRLIWPKLEWTGDIKLDKAIAERKFYREFSYRDMSKRGGHGSNYYGTPFTMARHLKVPTKLMEEFQPKYFSAFPGIPKYHRWVAEQLQITRSLTTVFGRERTFFGRANDDTTLREAIAYLPQSATGDRLNLILYRVWKHMPEVQLLAQVHDALYFQFDESLNESDVVAKALNLFHVPLYDEKSSRSYDVPGEAKTGWNWGDYDAETNPKGLKKFYGQDLRTRA
jgi:DNA polymerase-1